MLKKVKRRIGVKIDMTPMVDIAFLLLIFYMTTTSFKPPEKLHVTLPASHSEIKLPESNMIFVTVTKEDTVMVEYITKEKVTREGKELNEPVRHYEEANPTTLPQVITQIRGSVPGALGWFLVIKADKDVQYGTMSSIMDALQKIKISKFSLVTEMEMEKEKGKGT
ncbi:MAG: biopolymer transporter ExbD [Candidatus Zixiibacteriota bacterium]|jgi:biopolymer transport protein ExbD